jgi:alpha-beta hydrolase superfamily lysophospholipase
MDNHELHYIVDGNFESAEKPAYSYYKHYLPQDGKTDNVKYHLIFQHGALEYHQRHHQLYDSLRKKFNDEIIISCMDLVGSGQSGGSRSYISDFNHYKEDYYKFLTICKELKEAPFMILGGHSLGGLIVLSQMIEPYAITPFDVSSLVLVNPAIQPWLKVPAFVRTWLFEVTNKMAKIRLPSLYDGFDLTSDFERAVDFNNDQINNHFMTMKMGYEILHHSHHIAGMPYYLEHPCLFLTSGKDTVVNEEVTELFMHGMDKSHVTHHHYPEAYHDLLNETCRSEVFDRIIEYIKESETR